MPSQFKAWSERTDVQAGLILYRKEILSSISQQGKGLCWNSKYKNKLV